MKDNKSIIDLSQEGIIFYHVALLRGFRAAATHLGLSKSVVSSKVSSLETRLGRRLLFRSTRDVSLTPDGEIYFQACQDLFQATQKLSVSESGLQVGLSGVFTISAPHDFMNISLIPSLAKLQARHPKLRLNLLAADQVMNLEKNKIDLAIRAGADGDAHLFRTSFMKVELGFYCRSSVVPGKMSEKETLDWLLEEGALAFRPSREKSFQLNGKTHELRMQNKFQVHDVLSLKSLIMAGGGVGILPHFAVKAEVASGELMAILPTAEFKSINFAFLSGVKRQDDARLNAVIEFLIEESKV
jgi:Transcriptional regulator